MDFIKIVSFITTRNDEMAFVRLLSVRQIIKEVYSKLRYACALIYAAYLRKGEPINMYGIYDANPQPLNQIDLNTSIEFFSSCPDFPSVIFPVNKQ
jgi:hypothetical protein